MNERWMRHPLSRLALFGIACIAVIALLLRWMHHRHPADASPADDPVSAATSSSPAPTQEAAAQHANVNQILAACHPHLSLTPESVPNIDVSDKPNSAAVQLKVRFWVDGNGFVTHEFVTGADVVTPADQEMELDYVRHLTFMVPNTAECRARQMEMIGNFYESRDSGNAWSTVFVVHPRYSLEDGRVVQNR